MNTTAGHISLLNFFSQVIFITRFHVLKNEVAPMIGCAGAPCSRLKVHEGWWGCKENRRVPGWGGASCTLYIKSKGEGYLPEGGKG